ncbi:RICIN domain-containing protein [Streptomyces sp. NPDC086787]|uniref:RICIN domain-containing protein n=1 Tax=Streptomyces sp. NPDC086787 TaxID=3365759 RepID=UPI003811E62D
MSTAHPPRPASPPFGATTGESDEGLAAPLRAGSDAVASRSVALLMARHWRPAHEYAVICLATSGPLAHMVTATAFHQILDRLVLGESAEAIRPRLLVAVRDTVANWSAEDRISGVLPDLVKPAGGRGMRALKAMTPENRRLVERAFHGLPQFARCLLWHVEVEAEPMDIPAGLLGMSAGAAAAALDEARDKFREGCVRAHLELAPTKDCRYYNRLLDVPLRRGGALLPDVQAHLAECPYCRHAAEQLGHDEGGLGPMLAEAVLGWGARRYLDTRPGRTRPVDARTRTAARRGTGRRRAGSRGGGLLARVPGESWSSRTLLTGVGVAGAGLLATVLAVSAWPGGDDTAPVASTGVSATRGPSPSAGAASGLPTASPPTQLRNGASGQCLDTAGTPAAGAAVVLAACSPAPTQQWTYETDGQLRSTADADLCLDSHADAGVVILGACADGTSDRGDDVRYDLTSRGELLPRWDETLALAPADTNVVVKARDGSTGQHWSADRP